LVGTYKSNVWKWRVNFSVNFIINIWICTVHSFLLIFLITPQIMVQGMLLSRQETKHINKLNVRKWVTKLNFQLFTETVNISWLEPNYYLESHTLPYIRRPLNDKILKQEITVNTEFSISSCSF
jgi:hypothetical protein